MAEIGTFSEPWSSTQVVGVKTGSMLSSEVGDMKTVLHSGDRVLRILLGITAPYRGIAVEGQLKVL